MIIVPMLCGVAGLTHVTLYVVSGEPVYLFIALAYLGLAIVGGAAVVKPR